MKNLFRILIIASTYIAFASALVDCISEFCFTLPDSNERNDFNGAKSWCQSNNSSLAVFEDGNEARDSVLEFLEKWRSSSTDLIYIDVQLRQTTNTWNLINGIKLDGNVIYQDFNGYKLYGYLGEAVKGEGKWRVIASRPDDLRNYICEINATYCTDPNTTSDIFAFRGKCYRKYENVTVTWYEARKRCIDLSFGNDLATFTRTVSAIGDDSGAYYPDFNTSVLNLSLSYWIGVRSNNSAWISPSDSSNETLYDGWSDGKPNNTAYQCVCLDSNGKPQWSWTDCNCITERQFLCLKKIATTTTTTATTTTTPPSTILTTASVQTNQLNGTLSADERNLIIGVVIGVGGAILVAIVIIIIVCIIRRRTDPSSHSEAKNIGSEERNNAYEERDGQQLNDVEYNYAEVVPKTNQIDGDTVEQSKKSNEIIYADLHHSMKSAKASADEVDGEKLFINDNTRSIYSSNTNDIYVNGLE